MSSYVVAFYGEQSRRVNQGLQKTAKDLTLGVDTRGWNRNVEKQDEQEKTKKTETYASLLCPEEQVQRQ